MRAEERRPAFYALGTGGWRDYITLLHAPYTLWHLSYVAIGAALAPSFEVGRLAVGLLAFFLALGVGAHALDELNGRPLRTRIPKGALVGLAVTSLGAASAIGVVAAVAWTLWLLPLVAVGIFLVPAYCLELLGGRVHGDLWFALGWGAFPVVTGYLGMAETLRPEALLAAAFGALLSVAQRLLSTQVRTVRRQVVSLEGSISFANGREEPVTFQTLTRVPELVLRVLTATVTALALALVVARL
jgi:hypothetical protein